MAATSAGDGSGGESHHVGSRREGKYDAGLLPVDGRPTPCCRGMSTRYSARWHAWRPRAGVGSGGTAACEQRPRGRIVRGRSWVAVAGLHKTRQIARAILHR